MKKLLVISALWLIPAILFAHNYAPFRAQYLGSQTLNINQTLICSDTVTLTNRGVVFSLSINATIQLPNEGSFIRIVMEDTNGKDYLVAESDWMRNDTLIVELQDYCEETAMLDSVIPAYLKCYLSDATLSLHSITIASSKSANINGTNGNSVEQIRQQQVQNIVERINVYNERQGKLWRASVTDIALQPYSVRRRVLCLPDECSSQGMEYYAGGIFDMGRTSGSTIPVRDNSPYVESFDWRERHGRNWITPITHQGESGYCWAFSAVAATEALVNLYYNQKLDIDLSEQDVAYYTYPSGQSQYHYTHGGYVSDALNYIKNNGVIDEESLPFLDNPNPGLPNIRTTDYNELITISGYGLICYSNPDTVKIGRIKHNLMHKGPLVSGFRWMPNDSVNTNAHAMALVGYGTIHAGDTLMCYNHYWAGSGKLIVPYNSPYIGYTYWIFKNSYGIDDGYDHDGYMYILFKDLWSFYSTYYIQNPIFSSNRTDSEIVVEDMDGDGYFNWGIGQKPIHCPVWAPDEPDGDDSNFTKGPMNGFGYCMELDSLQKRYIYIDNDTSLVLNSPVYNHYVIWKGATVSIESSVVFDEGTELIVDKNSTLILDNVQLENVILRPQEGCNIIMRNNALINHHSSRDFMIPQGATLEIKYGTIQ